MQYGEDESLEASSEDDVLHGMWKWNSSRSKRNMQSLKFLSLKAVAANAKRNPFNPNSAMLPLHILCKK
jgi:hypothetical protein